jgi:hypothetical protein
MKEEPNLQKLASDIKKDLQDSGVDLEANTFYPCVKERDRYRILGRAFDDFSELRRVVGSHSQEQVFLLEPKNLANPVKIVIPSELL